eukprot:m.302818 g.302818  ORF g.302818 m.302818 type:complete len:91 (-) comp15476_c0_seq1:4-276(-)
MSKMVPVVILSSPSLRCGLGLRVVEVGAGVGLAEGRAVDCAFDDLEAGLELFVETDLELDGAGTTDELDCGIDDDGVGFIDEDCGFVEDD